VFYVLSYLFATRPNYCPTPAPLLDFSANGGTPNAPIIEASVRGLRRLKMSCARVEKVGQNQSFVKREARDVDEEFWEGVCRTGFCIGWQE